jgi:hypothetical protein
MGNGGIAPRILKLSARWSLVVILMSQSLYLREKSPLYPLDSWLGGPQSLSVRSGEEKKSQFLLGIETRSSSPQLSYYTEL